MEHPLKPEVKGKAHGITYDQSFDEAEAIVAAGLDLERYYLGMYSGKFVGFVLSWHRNHKLVQIHIDDANYRRPKK